VTASRTSAGNTETCLTGGHRNWNVRALMIAILLIRGRNWTVTTFLYLFAFYKVQPLNTGLMLFNNSLRHNEARSVCSQTTFITHAVSWAGHGNWAVWGMYCLRSLGSRDRGFDFPHKAWMFGMCLLCLCCPVLGQRPCDKLITRPMSPTVCKMIKIKKQPRHRRV
jgi:hypothetical protein